MKDAAARAREGQRSRRKVEERVKEESSCDWFDWLGGVIAVAITGSMRMREVRRRGWMRANWVLRMFCSAGVGCLLGNVAYRWLPPMLWPIPTKGRGMSVRK